MALIHILDKQSDKIIGTLNIGEYTDDEKVTSSENENTFDFTALRKFDLLQKRSRLLLQDKDGFFSEYLIIYAEQNARSRKDIKSNATFTDLQKAKIIEPQTLQGATADTSIDLALAGTEWRKGKVDYNGIRTLKIEEYTNPYNLLKRIASEFGLDLRFRVAVEGNKIVRYVDLTLPDDEFDGKEVVFGKDLIGLRRIEDAQNIVTALLVLGPEREDGTRLTVLVEDNDALQRWGRNGQHLIEVYEPQITAEDVTVERLRTLGQNALQKRIDALVTYECQAAILDHIPGKEHEKVRLDRTLRIKDEGYTPPLYVEAKVIEVKEQPSTGKILGFKLGNYKEFSKADLEAQIAGLKKQLNTSLSRLIQVSVTSSAGTVFKNGTGETDLTAVTILGGKEVDTDGLFYNYVWAKYDKNGNFVGATSGKSITVYARNIDEKETYIVTVENQGAKSIGQITVTNVNDGEQGPPGPKGDDGKTTYTWRKYADDANGTNMSDNPEGKQYLGMAFNKETPIASMNPQDYSWSAMYDTEKLEETKEIANNAVDVANKAKEDAQNAQSTADGKNTVFYQATAPSTVGRKINDLWFNTDDGYKPYYFNGSDWIPAPFGNAAIANLDAGKITTGYLSAARIAAKSIDVSKLNVSTLSAITANLGDITAGNISGVNITGVTITGSTIISDGIWQTTQSRVQLGNGVITVGDSSANNTVSPVGFIVEQDGGRLHHEFGADGVLFYGSAADVFKSGIYVQYEPYGNGISMVLAAENYTAVTSKFWVRNNEARFQSTENFIDPEPNVKKAIKASGGIATDVLYANAGSISKTAISTNGKIYVGGEGIEITWPGGTPYIDFVRMGGYDYNVRIIAQTDSLAFLFNNSSVVRHKFNADGTKSGGSIEIDGKNLGMSPIDSPQVLLETIEFDVPLTADGTKVLLDSRFAKAVNYRFAVFPNNGKVIEKGSDYFIIAGTGTADIRIVGERVGYAGVYFDDMEVA